MSKRLDLSKFQNTQAVSPALTAEDIQNAEFMSTIMARQAEIVEQNLGTRRIRFAEEFEKAVSQRTVKAIEVFRMKEQLSFYLK